MSGDLKSEDSVLEWLTDDDNRELEDEIEAVSDDVDKNPLCLRSSNHHRSTSACSTNFLRRLL